MVALQWPRVPRVVTALGDYSAPPFRSPLWEKRERSPSFRRCSRRVHLLISIHPSSRCTPPLLTPLPTLTPPTWRKGQVPLPPSSHSASCLPSPLHLYRATDRVNHHHPKQCPTSSTPGIVAAVSRHKATRPTSMRALVQSHTEGGCTRSRLLVYTRANLSTAIPLVNAGIYAILLEQIVRDSTGLSVRLLTLFYRQWPWPRVFCVWLHRVVR